MKRSIRSSETQDFNGTNTSEVSTSPAKNKKKKKKSKKEDFDDDVTFVENDTISEISDIINENASELLEISSQQTDNTITKKKKKKKRKHEDSKDVENINVSPKEEILIDIIQTSEKEKPNGQLKKSHFDAWTKENTIRLLEHIEEAIPENDNVKYSSRVNRIDWKSISFDNYTAEDCLKKWKQLQSKIRTYRILKEMVADAKLYIEETPKKHPDFPTKPLSSFMLFYLDVRNKILTENPGLSVITISKKVSEQWKSLSPKKLEKYKSKALKLKQEYEEKVKQFYEEHPDVPTFTALKPKSKKPKLDNLGFSKPRSAFQLYCANMCEKYKNLKPSEIKDKCKQKWKIMSEKKKAVWIEAAQKEEEQYRKNLKKYESEHPGYTAPPIKTLITKSDLHVLNNISGKPKKPPSNGYSLFSCEMLQSGVLATIAAKERLSEISRRWKNLTQDERNQYNTKCEKMHIQYKAECDKYLNSLSPEKRLEEEKKIVPKKRKAVASRSSAKRIRMMEPIKPPENEFELFKIKNSSQWKPGTTNFVDNQAQTSWKKLKSFEKKEYVDEITALKSEYIENLTEYLQHCPRDKLAEYVSVIAQHKQPVKQRIYSSEDSEPDSDTE